MFPVLLALVLCGPPALAEAGAESSLQPTESLIERLEDAVDRVEFMLDDLERYVRKSAHMKRFEDMGIPTALQGLERELDAVPGDSPGLEELRSRLRHAHRRLTTLEKRAAPALAAYAQQTQLSRYPTFAQDLEIMESIGKMYDVGSDPFDRPLDVDNHVRELHTIVGYVNGNESRYGKLMELASPEGVKMASAQERATDGLRDFMKHWRSFGQAGPDRAYDHVRRAFRTIRKTQTTGEMRTLMEARRHLRAAAEILHVLRLCRGPDQELLAPVDKSYEQARISLRQVEDALASELTAAMRAPQDGYRGSDRAEVESSTRVAWASRDLRAKVLEVRILDENWRRFNGVRWAPDSNQWEPYDIERLQATVVVRKDKAHATLHDVVIERDPETLRLQVRPAPVTTPREMLTANL